LLIEFIDLYNLVIDLQAYTVHLMIIFVLICTVGINAVREVTWWWCMLTTSYSSYWWCEWFSVRSLAPWDEDVVIL